MNNYEKLNENIVLHDIFDIKGGGERLAISLTNAIEGDLAYGKCSQNSFNLQKLHNYKKIDLGLKIEFAGLKTINLTKLFLNKTQFLSQYKNVLYSGIICPLAIENHHNGGNFYYCHTPPRFVYDKHVHYLNQSGLVQKLMLKFLVAWLKPQYEKSIALMDLVFTNSVFVKARIKKYLNRDSIVIYPPCNVNQYFFDQPQGYYLSTARFDPLKRVDKIIEAFIAMPDKNLVLCSTGTDDKKLRKLAKNAANISFTGAVDDTELSRLISQSIGTIYIPEDEDFGMSPVESMASGKPVICSGHGGPTESVIDGHTGLYVCETDLKNSLIETVNALDKNTAIGMRKACENRALEFSEEVFHEKIRQYVLG